MEHHPVAHINPDMGHRAGAVIGSREKDNIAGLCLGGRNDGTLVINALRRGTGQSFMPEQSKSRRKNIYGRKGKPFCVNSRL